MGGTLLGGILYRLGIDGEPLEWESVKKVYERPTQCSEDSRRVFVSLGYAILTAETKSEVNTLFKVLCGEGSLEDVSDFMPQSAQVVRYVGNHNPTHWPKCKAWNDW